MLIFFIKKIYKKSSKKLVVITIASHFEKIFIVIKNFLKLTKIIASSFFILQRFNCYTEDYVVINTINV